MNRLQKKCFLVSAGMHLLLPLILIFGAALTPTPKTIEAPILTFIPLATTDKEISGGGNPNAHTAPAQLNQPIAPAPKPPQTPKAAEKVREPDPAKEEIKPKTEAESFEVAKDSQKKKLNIPLDLKSRPNTSKPKQLAKNTTDDKSEREALEKQKQLLKDIGSAANDLHENRSTEVKFDDFTGPGGGGIPYANFLAGVKTIYTRAWNVPDGVEDDEATTEVSVTIDRSGKVVRSSILRRSGNAFVDHSVQMTLDRVRQVVPLPADSKVDERTVTIGFNVKAKRGMG